MRFVPTPRVPVTLRPRTLLAVALALAPIADRAAEPPAAQAAGRDVLAPGLVAERLVRPGPVVVDLIRLDRYPQRRGSASDPLFRVTATSGTRLSSGRTRLSQIVRDRLSDGAVAGINGDYFSWSGVPTGLLLDERGLIRDPAAFRSSAVFDRAGALHVARLGLDGSLVALGAEGAPTGSRVAIQAINRLALPGETVLYSPEFGRRTPPSPGVPSLVVALDDPQAPLIGPLSARVLASGGAGGISLAGRIVVALGGSRGAALARRLGPGDRVLVDLAVPGLAADPATGIGGGPLLVADGEPVDAREGFSSAQVGARTARSAIGQTRNGTLLLASVRDGRSGPSRGVTTGELAALMSDLGAWTAMGLDSGGSSGISVLGSAPANVGAGGERAIATALVISYRGVQLRPADPARVTPNGDRSAETTTAALRLTTRSAVRVTLRDSRGRRAARLAAGWLDAGVRRVRVPARELEDGRYTISVVARAQDARTATRARRTVVVNRTLGHLRAAGRSRGAVLSFRLTRPARVSAAVRVPGGWKTVVSGRRLGAGSPGLRIPAPPGRRTVRLSARSRLGVSTLSTVVRVRR